MMTFRIGLTAALLIVVATADAAASRIYKTVDEQGNVIFTDIPPREEVKGEQVVIEDPNTFNAGEAVPETEQWIVETSEAGEETAGASSPYAALNIVSPQNDEAVRENAGNVTIVANVDPRLRPDHQMRLIMDGEVVQEGRQTTFQLANVDRGTHMVSLEIVDGSNQVLIRSEGISFHLLRYAVQRQPRSGGG